MRDRVQQIIAEERQHQDQKWGTVQDRPHEVGGWLTIMRVYLGQAEQAWATSANDAEALAAVRKVAALGAACLEQHLTLM